MVADVQSLEHFRQLIKSDKGTVFDFWAAWCAPCKAISPVYDAFSQRHPELGFYKVNVSELPEVSKAAGIRALPTFQAYKSGVKVHEISASNQPALEGFFREALARIRGT
ncbi:thioredoxin [Panus rudis PR-1116 ss-1]|nr:thioredoxin [Panus rudis PR-1116 ss-1]